MINSSFNVGAVSGAAKVIRESQGEPIYFPHYDEVFK